MPREYTRSCAAYAGTPNPLWTTLFTSMFLHAGWTHILGNMVFLFVFGNTSRGRTMTPKGMSVPSLLVG